MKVDAQQKASLMKAYGFEMMLIARIRRIRRNGYWNCFI